MGQYNKAVLTTAGEKLIARALAGEIKLNITEAKTSDYVYSVSTDFKSLTDMQEIRQTIRKPETTVIKETMIQTRVLLSNEEITSTYYIHNIGLYATDGTEEVLFCIVTAETPDEMPRYNGVASTSYIYNIQNVVEDAGEISITVNSAGVATIQDVRERVEATGGDISETVIKTLDNIEDKYPIPTTGDNVKRFFGKVLTFLRNIKPLTSDIALYVSANTGSDIFGDGSQAKPYKTIQHAVDIVPKDLGGNEAIIYVASGNYDEHINLVSFRGGILKLYSDTIDTLSNTCKIKSLDVKYCSSYVFINGFTFTDKDAEAIIVWGCFSTHINSCQSVIQSKNKLGIYYGESQGGINCCKFANRLTALQAINSRITSYNWDSGSTGNDYGLQSFNGSIIMKIGTQPIGIKKTESSGVGGAFFNENGTQVTGPITSNLICNWGTLSGGYVRHGNLNGDSLVTIQIGLVTNTNISPGNTYLITGFPAPATGNCIVTFGPQYVVENCYIQGNTIYFTPKVSVNSVAGFLFSATYLAN
ncbi:MAG: hypothetical protein E7247_01700 [Paenibacillaceae bacterium]|nr:hypothetical protein [Paenibacillaceae bacterium]